MFDTKCLGHFTGYFMDNESVYIQKTFVLIGKWGSVTIPIPKQKMSCWLECR